MEAIYLFDIDGTLVDSSEVVERVWRQLAAEFDADASAIVRACHGRRDVDVVEDFFAAADARAVLDRVAELEAEAVEGVVVVPGAARC